MLDHFFPLLFPKDSESLKILDIRLWEVGSKRAHRSDLPPYLISHGKLVYTFKYAYMNFPNKGTTCHHNINGGTQISLLGNYLQRGVCISISAMVILAQGGSATNGATLSSLSQIVPANFHRMTLFLSKSMLG